MDCDDFPTHRKAQAYFDLDTYNLNNLDADGDEIACEIPKFEGEY
jgi:hypothetical protein